MSWLARRAFLLAAAAGWPALARAQTLPAPAAPRPPAALKLHNLMLANGLRVLLAPRPGWPLVTVQLQLGLGSLLDPPAQAGLTQLFLDVLSRGVQRGRPGSGRVADGAEIAFTAESLGASFESQTQALAGSLSLSLAAPRLEEALALLADLVRRPTLPASGLERARQLMLENLRQTQADPAALAQALGRRLFWGESAAGRLATPASLNRIRRDDLLALQRSQLGPALSSLIICGDFEPAALQPLLEREFGGWRGGAQSGRQPPQVQPRPLAARSVFVDLPGAGQSAVQILAPHAGLAAGDELPAGLLAQAVLGQGYSSRLGREVRIKRGLSYGASSQVESLPGSGWLSAYAQTRHESAAEVARVMALEIQRLGEQAVEAEELAARRASWLGEQQRRLESTAGLAAALGEQLQQGLAPEALGRWGERLQAVDAATLQAFAARYWRGEALRRVVVGDLAAAGPALRALDPAAWIIPAAELDLGSPTLRRPSRRGRGALEGRALRPG